MWIYPVVLLVTSCASQHSDEKRFSFVLHDGLTAADVAHLDAALNDAYQNILGRLALEAIPQITVQIWRDEENYQAAMEETFGLRAPGSRGYVTGDREMRLLYHTLLSAQREAVHEFVHVVSLNVNPDFGNNPRWLWEALAIYFAEEFVSPMSSGAFEASNCPTLKVMNSPFDRGGTIYSTGYLLGEFIESKWGAEQLIALVKSNGNLKGALNITESEFEDKWCQFVTETYLSND
jgi:hypothetical protein